MQNNENGKGNIPGTEAKADKRNKWVALRG